MFRFSDMALREIRKFQKKADLQLHSSGKAPLKVKRFKPNETKNKSKAVEKQFKVLIYCPKCPAGTDGTYSFSDLPAELADRLASSNGLGTCCQACGQEKWHRFIDGL